MGFSNDFTSKLKKATDTATKKVEELTGTAKLSFEIYSLKNGLDDLYCDLGKAVYLNNHSERPNEEIIHQMMGKIEEKIAELRDLEQRHSEMKRVKVCHTCGFKNYDENVFCSACGNKL